MDEEKKNVQWKAILAKVNPTIIPGALTNMILLLPMESIHLSAIRVKMKFVPDTINPTAVG